MLCQLASNFFMDDYHAAFGFNREFYFMGMCVCLLYANSYARNAQNCGCGYQSKGNLKRTPTRDNMWKIENRSQRIEQMAMHTGRRFKYIAFLECTFQFCCTHNFSNRRHLIPKSFLLAFVVAMASFIIYVSLFRIFLRVSSISSYTKDFELCRLLQLLTIPPFRLYHNRNVK